jgi:hypothetical protein
MRRFRNPPRRPRSIGYLSADDRWQQWGWTVDLERPERAFSSIGRARRRGFILTGTGRAIVQTPDVYRLRARVRVVQRGLVDSSEEMTVGGTGRLRIVVPLGDGTTAATTRVSIRPVDGGY